MQSPPGRCLGRLECNGLWGAASAIFLWDTLNALSGNSDFWTAWRTQITFQVIKLLFALSAAPFFIFTIGPLSKLFTHTDPTAWTRSGQIVPPDPTGLEAYLRWISNDVLQSKAWADELHDRFPERDIKRLRRAVVDGEKCLKEAWWRPSSARRVMTWRNLDLPGAVPPRMTNGRDLIDECKGFFSFVMLG